MLSLFTAHNIETDLSFIGADIHSHILPGLDDGSENIAESVGLIRELHSLGYRKLICTPHILPGVYNNSANTILPALVNMREALAKADLPVLLEAAAEYMIDDELAAQIKRKEHFLTFGENYILVEMSFMEESPYLHQVLFDLKVNGLQPILAHPERYAYFQERFQEYRDLKSRGFLFQLNLLSLTGYYGGPAKRTAQKLLEQEMVDFVGTDLHHQDHLEALKEFADNKNVYKLLKAAHLLNTTLLN